MSEKLSSILVAGTVESDSYDLAAALPPRAGQVRWAGDAQRLTAELATGRPDLVLLTVGEDRLSPEEALTALRSAREAFADLPVVVHDAHGDAEWAVAFVRAGAYDYISREVDDSVLLRLTRRVLAEFAPNRKGREDMLSPNCPAGVELVGRSPGMEQALELIRLVAQSGCNPVLICGPTGTGKELAARAVHAWRCGGAKPFVAVNCATLNAQLLESELFGHTKGSFTGADRDKMGLFEAAGDGTLLLDEISEMPQELQAKLLRVLQERTFRKVGGTQDIACSATIIASSNRNLLAESEAGRFRKDLYYRLAVFPIHLPALSSPERRSDIPLLAQHFCQCSQVSRLGQVRGLTAEANRRLLAHHWPGNARELRNVIERAMILASGEWIGPESLRIDAAPASAESAAGAMGEAQRDFSIKSAERQLILRALRETNWHRTQAASLLGITRATLHAKLKRYEIEAPGGEADDAAADSEDCLQALAS